MVIECVVERPSEGVKNGSIVNIEQTMKVIGSVIGEAEVQAGTEISSVIIGIGGDQIKGIKSNGVVGINSKDQEITKDPVSTRAKKGVGYLAQEASVFRTMSVEDNIMTVLEMKYKSVDEQREHLERLLDEFNLQKVRRNNGNQLSGGERRRCEIARCLAIDPKFIMLDEPFAGVDPIAVEDIQYVVWKLKDRNIGILITDHNVQETLCITDRAYLLFEGRILFKGTPEELSQNTIVKEKYLGSNFVLRPKDFQMIEEKKKKEMEQN